MLYLGVRVVLEQKTTLRLKSFRISSFRILVLDAFELVVLYQLNSALIGTEKWEGISRVLAPFSQIGSTGTEIKSA
jgi:hypothetical protein